MRILSLVVALALPLAACDGGAGAFCERGTEMAERLDSGEFDPTDRDDVRSFADEMAALAEDAPDAIKGEVETIADGLSKLSEGDISAAQDPEFFPALERFGEYAEREC